MTFIYDNRMIPKIIHYCWFGGRPLPRCVVDCISSWRSVLPEYEIREWNESNFDVFSSVAYVKEAYEAKKYAFVSDYVRLYALKNYGGLYLDTDVKVLKTFDSFLDNSCFMGLEAEGRLSTAVIASEKNAPFVVSVINRYMDRHFIIDGKYDLTTNVQFISEYAKSIGVDLDKTSESQECLTVYPIDFFSPKSWETGKYNITGNTVCIHLYAGTWHSPIVRFLSIFFNNDNVSKIVSIKGRILSFLRRS